MRRTKHRRRFHTRRVVRNRQRRYVETPTWRFGWLEDLEDGRLEDRNAYFGCSRPHCYLCHWEKYLIPRRAQEKRAWKKEVYDQLV